MKHLIAALRFTTILPVGNKAAFEPLKMLPFFPVVGLLIGGILFAVDHVLLRLWSPPVVAVFDVLLLVGLTGAFHMDGLADTFDGLYGQWDRETALTIMKDSRIGTMGMVGVVSVLAIKWCGLMELSHHRGVMLVVIPALSRSSVLFGIRFLSYGRSSEGLGHKFFLQKLKPKMFWPVAIPVMLTLTTGWQGLVLLMAFLGITAGIIYYYKRKIDCVTGDMLGAMIEITEAGLLIVAAAGSFT